MSSGFSGGGGGGVPDFFTAAGGGLTGRSSSMNTNINNNNNNNPHNLYRSQLAGVYANPSSQNNHRRPDYIGKRTLAEFQTHNLQQQQQQHQSVFNLSQNLQQQQQQQQQQLLGLYLRSVKPRIYQNSSPISPLSPIDFSGSISPEISALSSSPANLSGRYGLPMIQQLRSQQMSLNNQSLSGVSYPNLMQERVSGRESGMETEKKMMNRLQELEKELLDDNDDDDQHCDDVSVITGSEWSNAIQSLMTSNQKPIPLSPSSSSSTSSSSTSVVSPVPPCSKQSLMDAASAISEGKNEAAAEIIARLSQQGSNPQGSPEQRMVCYMTAALKSRLNPTENPPPVSELFGKEQMESTQLLFQHSSSFKLSFMAANLAIIEATAEAKTFHVVDFNIGQGLQYQNLLQLLSLRNSGKPTMIRITAVEDVVNGGGEERLMAVGEKLRQLGGKVGISVQFNNLSLKISDLSRESLGCDSEEVLVVNFAYTLFRMADESVSTENPRDQLLRRVKGLGPRVTTLVEQEMNCNTTQFVSRVNECCNYYGALFDSLDSSMARDNNNNSNSERVKVEEGLSRKMGNSVACEGRDRVERCEVFGKWRARMGMAGFQLKPVSQPVTDSLKARANSGTRVDPGFTVKEENGGVCFGWMGRTLTVASAWR